MRGDVAKVRVATAVAAVSLAEITTSQLLLLLLYVPRRLLLLRGEDYNEPHFWL